VDSWSGVSTRAVDPQRWGNAPVPAAVAPAAVASASRWYRARWAWWLALGLVVAVAGTVIAVLSVGGRSDGPAPAQVVSRYLADLAAGDAAGALALGAGPVNGPFLTDSVLKAQQRDDPITDVSVGTATVSEHSATVAARYRFGSGVADASFALIQQHNRWQLSQTSYAIDTSALASIPEPTLFGTPIANATSVQVFPGPLVWGSANRYFQVTASNPAFPTSPAGAVPDVVLAATLNPAGTAAVHTALSSYLAGCAHSDRLAPTGCPQQEDGFDAVEGTAHWTAPAQPADLKIQPSDPLTTVQIQAAATWQCSYRADSDGRRASVTDRAVPSSLDGTIDLTAQTPTFVPTGS
jgi:hypothetical protein